GLQKGGVYNHFKSKDELALATYDAVLAELNSRYRQVLRRDRHAVDRLQAMLQAFPFRDFAESSDPLLKGGCPLLNMAIDSDDTHPALRAKIAAAVKDWQSLIESVVCKGIARQQIRPDIQAEQVATVIIAALEGSVMLVKLHADVTYLHRTLEHLNQYVEGLRRET
ncbi:MAG: TetR/AcrR family transcriptional regulator, partial [Leptolyngbya sp. SIO4C1]|nr:TetR/AcrR family transcriptional regulator [Leptolyngbya sp. SIO4C1]